MAKKFYEESNIEAIAQKIREKTGGTKTYTTAAMPSGVEEVYNKGYETGYATGTTSKVLDLTGTTWVLNATLNLSQFSYNINFNSNGNTYTRIDTSYGYNGQKYYYVLYYYNTNNSPYGVYGINGSDSWSETVYQTITITGGADAINTDLINWLYANGTRGDVDYNVGYNDGYNMGYDTGYGTGYDVGYDIGYDTGVDITNDATATADKILEGSSAYVGGKKIDGVMPYLSNAIQSSQTACVSMSHPSGDARTLNIQTDVHLSDAHDVYGVPSDFTIHTSLPFSSWGNYFGDAMASDVVAGKRFTSFYGFDIVGTATVGSPPPLIRFSLDGGSYIAYEGMTWAQWCDSKANINGYYVDSDDTIMSADGQYYVIDAIESSVYASEVIEDGMVYNVYGIDW